MNKPQSLRHALNQAVPYVRNNPDKLHLFVDNGSLVATGASSMSWEYRYTLNVVIEDFSGDQNLLMAPVLLWLRDNQPDAINNPALREKLFTFEVDILRNDVCDISLKVQRIARVHHYGLRDRVSPKGGVIKYPSRKLLGLNEHTENEVRDLLLKYLLMKN